MANNLTVKDAASADQVIKTTDAGGVHTPHHNVDAIAAGDNNIGNVDIVTLPELPAGDNNIGDVDVASLPALPAGTNLIGKVGIDQVTANANEVVIKSTLPATALHDGTQAGAAEAAPLNGGTSLPCRAVLVQNKPGSSANLLVGNATSQSVEWAAGFGQVIEIDNVNKVYIKGVGATANWHAI